MKYEKTTELSMEKAEEKVTEILKSHGFGVLTKIDVSAKIKEKLNIDREPYVILGACNPKLANEALDMNPDVGYLLACNVVIQKKKGQTFIGAILPTAMLAIVSDKLGDIAGSAESLLKKAIDEV